MIRESRDAMVCVIGLPTDRNSSYIRGAAGGPDRIRKALRCPSTNMCSESGVDLGQGTGWIDVGDVDLCEGASQIQAIENRVSRLLGRGNRLIALGGDHSISHPVVRAVAERHGALTILHLDAHADLYDEFDGSRESHACPFARIMEESLAKRLIQVGIRTLNPHQKDQAGRFGVEVHGVRSLPELADLGLEAPVYLSIDLDVLDPAFAPGVAHPEPGGLSTRDVISLTQDLPLPLVGADIVELNPGRDPQGLTAMVAAKLLKEILANMLQV